jgi:cytochrome c556
MKFKIVKILSTLILFGSFSFAYAESENEKNIESLSPELRVLLQKEMQAIEEAMGEILTANASGDLKQIASLGKQIKESFILKKSLTKSQKHELHTLLPEGFIKKDQEFHYNAGMLEHVAENKKVELVGFYYSKLFEACSSCHQDFAKHRFPIFNVTKQNNKHEH